MAEIQVKKVKPLTVMGLSFSGSYGQTQDKLQELMSWLLRAGHPYSDYPLGLFYDDPTKVPEDKLRAEVCLPIEEECEPDEEVKRKDLPEATVASLLHQGAYSEIQAAYQRLFNWITANGYRYDNSQPVREVYLRIYGQVDNPADFLTEIQVPVEKA